MVGSAAPLAHMLQAYGMTRIQLSDDHFRRSIDGSLRESRPLQARNKILNHTIKVGRIQTFFFNEALDHAHW